MIIYFTDLISTVMGEIYFRVSKHLKIPISEVIRKKFTPDIRLLINFYNKEIQAEIRERKKYEEEVNKNG